MKEDLITILSEIQAVEEKLKASENFGCLDMLFGGFWLSYFKRQKMKECDSALQNLANSLRALTEKYPQLDLISPQLDSRKGAGWDIFFDNIFSDVITQNRIGETLQNLRTLKGRVQLLLDQENKKG